jgi:hypothetical protein
MEGERERVRESVPQQRSTLLNVAKRLKNTVTHPPNWEMIERIFNLNEMNLPVFK